MEQLEKDGNYNDYLEPKVPFCFKWIYTCYLELYKYSGESITWTTIESYGNIRNIKFTQVEIDYIILMDNWANEKIAELKEEQES